VSAATNSHPGHAVTPTHSTTLIAVGATTLVATGLWIASGFINRFLFRNVAGEPNQVINLLVPRALDFRLSAEGYRVSATAAIACAALALVVAGVTYLAVFRLRPDQGRLTLFLATWFAAVAGSFAASAIQALGFASELGQLPRTELVNIVVPQITGGGYWGVTLGWLAGATAVIVFSLGARPTAL
jgi:hypothetical protein